MWYKAVASSSSHKYKAVTLPDLDPAGLKGEDTHKMNREDVVNKNKKPQN